VVELIPVLSLFAAVFRALGVGKSSLFFVGRRNAIRLRVVMVVSVSQYLVLSAPASPLLVPLISLELTAALFKTFLIASIIHSAIWALVSASRRWSVVLSAWVGVPLCAD
jgi:hypothetical protein